MIRSILMFDFTSDRMYKEAEYALAEYASALLDKTYDLIFDVFGIDYPNDGTTNLVAVRPALRGAGMDNMVSVLSDFLPDAEGDDLLMWCERLNHALHFDFPRAVLDRRFMHSPSGGPGAPYDPIVALNADDDSAPLLVRYRTTFALAQLMDGDEPGAYGLRDRGKWKTARQDEWRRFPSLEAAIGIAEGHVDGRRIRHAMSRQMGRS